MEHKFRIKLNS